MTALLDRYASGRVAAFAMAAVAALLGAENTLDFPGSAVRMERLTGRSFLDMCGFCSADRLHGDLEAFGAVGRQLQMDMLLSVDLVIPVACLIGTSLALAWARGPRWARALPFVALALDLTENALILGLIALWPTRVASLESVLGLVTGAKFVAYGASAAAIGALLVTRAAVRARCRPPPVRPRPSAGGPATDARRPYRRRW